MDNGLDKVNEAQQELNSLLNVIQEEEEKSQKRNKYIQESK